MLLYIVVVSRYELGVGKDEMTMCCSLKQSSLCPQEKLSPCSRPCPFRKPGALAAMATHMSTGRSYHLTGRRSKLSEIP
ncbi:hypothetical protein PC112_g16550 [Phytophthora cactorum]|nr:hypothetical protein PC112_g16550 [Phytophthora cactorum]